MFTIGNVLHHKNTGTVRLELSGGLTQADQKVVPFFEAQVLRRLAIDEIWDGIWYENIHKRNHPTKRQVELFNDMEEILDPIEGK